MTLWQDQPPQTRREARERERARTEALEAAALGSRRATTVEPTPAGAEFMPPARPRLPRYENSFDDLLAPEPETSDLFRPGASADVAQPVTVPLVVMAEPDTWPPQSETIVPEHTLTRRELRAMLQAEEANEQAQEPQAAPVIEAQSVEPEPELAAETVPDAAPVGHWSTTESTNAHDLHFDQVIGQNVDSAGSGSATSALILPVVPSAPDAMGPLTSTGEILVTGTIDLPRSLGATGQHPDHFDSADMDRLFDSETDANTSSVAPIRASRAISTHNSTRGMITPPKKRGGRLPVILAVTAAVLAVGVIALVVAGFIFKVF